MIVFLNETTHIDKLFQLTYNHIALRKQVETAPPLFSTFSFFSAADHY